MDQPGMNAEQIFKAIVKQSELDKCAGEFDNRDHSGGNNVPNSKQIAQSKAIMAKAKELRKLLG